MNLNQVLKQKDMSREPNARLMPTRRASGPQWACSDLVADLVTQLRFCDLVVDIETYTLVPTNTGATITVDVFYRTHASFGGVCERVLVFVEDPRRGPILLSVLDQVHLWAEPFFVDVRVIREQAIRTPYLENARRLEPLRAESPDWDGDLEGVLMDHLAAGNSTVAVAVSALTERGMSDNAAFELIARNVVHRGVLCDLCEPFGLQSILRMGDGRERSDNRSDAFLRIIADAH